MPYIYQADCWCDSCGESIKSRLLDAATDDEKAEREDEGTYDSDDFPKWMSDSEESDSPCHCAGGQECLEAETLTGGRKVGALLSTSLTADGIEYVKTAVAEGGDCAEFWRSQFDYIDFPSDEDEDDHEHYTSVEGGGCIDA